MDDDSDDIDRGRPGWPPEARPYAFRRTGGRHIRTPKARRSTPLVDAAAASWKVEAFVADDGTVPFERFAEDLPNQKYTALRAAVTRVLAVRGMALAGTEWLKPLGGGLHEFRIRHNAQEIHRMFGSAAGTVTPARGKVLLRVFIHFYGDKVILLLGGYDKGVSPKERRQQREIAEARRLLAQFKRQRRRRPERGSR